MGIGFHSRLVASVVLAFVSCAVVAKANPIPDQLTEEKIARRIAARDSTRRALEDADLEIQMDALYGSNVVARDAAMTAMARDGTPEALAALRAALVDASFAVRQRVGMAQALGKAGDTVALPAVKGLSGEAHEMGVVYGAVIDLVVRLLERPELRHPIIARVGERLEFRFQVHDIQSICLLGDSLTFTLDGLVCRYGPDHSQHRTEVDPSEFGAVSELLSEGSLENPPSSYGMGGHLVLELADGRHLALMRDGNAFFLTGTWDFDARPYCVRSDTLASLLNQLRQSQRSARASGESPN